MSGDMNFPDERQQARGSPVAESSTAEMLLDDNALTWGVIGYLIFRMRYRWPLAIFMTAQEDTSLS